MKKTIAIAFILLSGICCARAGRPQRVVVLGDSYSTFEGCIPDNYSCWYFSEEGKGNDVHDAGQCWWSLLCREMGFRLLLNSSYSGSTVCNTGYGGRDASGSSFVTRMKTDIATPDGRRPRCRKKPDLVLIFGGTNDVWSGAPQGETVGPEEWENVDLTEFYPASCHMVGYLKSRLPEARIVLVCNTELGAGFEDTYAEIARLYGVECLQLHDISKQGGHPDIAGMRAIADQLEAYL